MSKEQWIEAREQVIMEKINQFELEKGYYPSDSDIEEMENSITESDIVDNYSAMVDYTVEMLKD